MPKPKKRRKPLERGVPVSVWMRVGLLVQMDRAADREGISRSELVERAVQNELESKRPQQAAAA